MRITLHLLLIESESHSWENNTGHLYGLDYRTVGYGGASNQVPHQELALMVIVARVLKPLLASL